MFSKRAIAVCAAISLAAVSSSLADDFFTSASAGGAAAPSASSTGTATQPCCGENCGAACDDPSGNCAGFNGCASCDACSGLVGGVEAAILRPRPGMSVSELGILGVNAVPYRENQYDFTPRIWLGYVNNCGLGVRIRYWTFDEGLAQDEGTFTVGNETLVGSGMLRANTVDLETMQEIHWGCWGVNVGAGLRYGSVVQELSTQIIEPGIAYNVTLNQTGSFFGIGPTLFAEFHRPIGESGLALVANLRGSLLFGTDTNAITVTNNAVVPPTTMPYLAKQDQAVGIAEIQMGLEWTRSLSQGRSLFVQALWEGQIWDGMQNSAYYYYGSGQTNLGLDGFSFSIGFSR
jgi:hypothetical protein